MPDVIQHLVITWVGQEAYMSGPQHLTPKQYQEALNAIQRYQQPVSQPAAEQPAGPPAVLEFSAPAPTPHALPPEVLRKWDEEDTNYMSAYARQTVRACGWGGHDFDGDPEDRHVALTCARCNVMKFKNTTESEIRQYYQSVVPVPLLAGVSSEP